jgi:DNA-binding MarR family transcriptional regulator
MLVRHHRPSRSILDVKQLTLVIVERQATLNRLEASLALLLRAQRSRVERERALRSGVWRSSTALAMLAHLERHAAERVTRLADRSGVDVTRASRELRALARDGLTRSRRDPADRRAVVVEITDEGRAEWSAYRAASRAMLDTVLADWDDETVADFTTLFERFVGCVSRPLT